MIETYLATLLLICVQDVYVYCMYRKGKIFGCYWVQVVHRSKFVFTGLFALVP